MTSKRILRALLRPISYAVFVRLFPLWERIGFYIIPNDFYQPIPDTRTLKDELWLRQSELIGIDMNEQNNQCFSMNYQDLKMNMMLSQKARHQNRTYST